VIGSGWWCNAEPRASWQTTGDDLIRSAAFHTLWYESICRNTSPVRILMLDSNSPVKPPLNPNDDRIEFVSLPVNSGHSTEDRHFFCGWTKSVLMGMLYAACSEVDYFVYVEQDVLLKGEGIVEHAIAQMKRDYMFGSGAGTPQVLQQSFFIIRTTAAFEFIKRYNRINASDADLSPEYKFAVCASDWYQAAEPFLSRLKYKRRKKLLCKYPGFDELPFGYGRTRPINFSDPFLYFQHGTREEIEAYAACCDINLQSLKE